MALGLAVGTAEVPRAQGPSLVEALNLYERANYAEFFDVIERAVAIERELFRRFEKEASIWLKPTAEPPLERRRLVAASVALEIAYRLRKEPPDRANEFLVWAGRYLRESSRFVPSSPEYWWYMAALAIANELEYPWAAALGLLAVASDRFPDEPRFALARVEAAAVELRHEIGFLPAALEFIKAHAVVPEGYVPSSEEERWALDVKVSNATILRRRARIPAVILAYQRLDTHLSLRSEVALYVGYLEAAQLNWPAAVDHLQRVETLTSDPHLRYLSHYFIGRSLQAMGQHEGAVGAFERALQIVPKARSASTLLAAELLLSDHVTERDRAYPLLQAAYSDSSPPDPWWYFWRGDARFRHTYMAKLRQALQ